MDCMQISKQATANLSLIFGNDMYARSNVEVAIVVQTSCYNNSFQKLSTSCVFTIIQSCSLVVVPSLEQHINL